MSCLPVMVAGDLVVDHLVVVISVVVSFSANSGVVVSSSPIVIIGRQDFNDSSNNKEV